MKEQLLFTTVQVYVLIRHEGACSMYHCTGMYLPDMKEQLICILMYRYMYWPDMNEQLLCNTLQIVLTRHEGTTFITTVKVCTDPTWRNNFYVPLYRYVYWPDMKEQLLYTTVQVRVLTWHEGTTSMYHCTGMCTDPTWRNNFYVPLYRYMYWPDMKEQLLCTTVQVCTDPTWRKNFYVPLYRYVLTRHEGKTFMYHCTN